MDWDSSLETLWAIEDCIDMMYEVAKNGFDEGRSTAREVSRTSDQCDVAVEQVGTIEKREAQKEGLILDDEGFTLLLLQAQLKLSSYSLFASTVAEANQLSFGMVAACQLDPIYRDLVKVTPSESRPAFIGLRFMFFFCEDFE